MPRCTCRAACSGCEVVCKCAVISALLGGTVPPLPLSLSLVPHMLVTWGVGCKILHWLTVATPQYHSCVICAPSPVICRRPCAVPATAMTTQYRNNRTRPALPPPPSDNRSTSDAHIQTRASLTAAPVSHCIPAASTTRSFPTGKIWSCRGTASRIRRPRNPRKRRRARSEQLMQTWWLWSASVSL